MTPKCLWIYTVYPKKYAHGFVVICFVVLMQSFIMNSHELFIHIHQGCFAGTGAIVRLSQCQWSKPDGYGKISQCITTTKHSKAKTVCIFLGIYCITGRGDVKLTFSNAILLPMRLFDDIKVCGMPISERKIATKSSVLIHLHLISLSFGKIFTNIFLMNAEVVQFILTKTLCKPYLPLNKVSQLMNIFVKSSLIFINVSVSNG